MNHTPVFERDAASFRDPSGFVFWQDGVLYRQINQIYRSHYERLIGSGLFERLVREDLLIPHEECGVAPPQPEQAYCVIQPAQIAFVSYPYEWCFSQLKDAALATLRIQALAIEHGMSLKDASAYNIQFHLGRPTLVDTLSFEPYQEGRPWIPYRQFCQHFLGPLALMAHKDVRLGQLLRVHLDGIPLDLVGRLLPWHTRINMGLATHVHLHAGAQKHLSDREAAGRSGGSVSRLGLCGLVDSLCSTIERLRWNPRQTAWARYYDECGYTDAALQDKQRLVHQYLSLLRPKRVWDLGANTGAFAQIATSMGAFCVAIDSDPGAVEAAYRSCREARDANLLPLLMDLTNPSPGVGWESQERASLLDRAPADTVLALALVHHLAIGNNTPLPLIARLFSKLGRSLIVEWIPKEDPQVQRMLTSRDDIFASYDRERFESAISAFFSLEACEPIRNTNRSLYCCKGLEE